MQAPPQAWTRLSAEAGIIQSVFSYKVYEPEATRGCYAAGLEQLIGGLTRPPQSDAAVETALTKATFWFRLLSCIFERRSE